MKNVLSYHIICLKCYFQAAKIESEHVLHRHDFQHEPHVSVMLKNDDLIERGPEELSFTTGVSLPVKS